MRKFKNIALYLFLASCFIAVLYAITAYHAYEDIHGPHFLTLDSYSDAIRNQTRIADYTAPSDTFPHIYLLRGTWHETGSQSFTDEYYAYSTDKFSLDSRRVCAADNGLSLQAGHISGLGSFDHIPPELLLQDSLGQILAVYTMTKSYPENAALGPRKSYWREWRRILSE